MQLSKTLVCWPAALLLAGAVAAQTPVGTNSPRVPHADATFVRSAAEGGMAEVEMGRLAVQHGSNDAVKQFGQRMIDDHSKANDELKDIASRKGLTVPGAPTAKQKATISHLEKLNGAEFDRAYMQDMVRDHQEDVAEFKKEADNGADPDVKSFAGKTLPTLQQHLQMAQDTEAKVK
jgi:putative membrane protein